jgi:hypothetical protein
LDVDIDIGEAGGLFIVMILKNLVAKKPYRTLERKERDILMSKRNEYLKANGLAACIGATGSHT